MKRVLATSLVLITLVACAPKRAPQVCIPERAPYPAVHFDENGCLDSTNRRAFIIREQEQKAYEEALIRTLEIMGAKPPVDSKWTPSQ